MYLYSLVKPVGIKNRSNMLAAELPIHAYAANLGDYFFIALTGSQKVFKLIYVLAAGLKTRLRTFCPLFCCWLMKEAGTDYN